VRYSLDLDAARELLSMIDTIDELWKGPADWRRRASTAGRAEPA
jgi:hypothetical protein